MDGDVGLRVDGVALVHQPLKHPPRVLARQQGPGVLSPDPANQDVQVRLQPDGDGVLLHQGAGLGVHEGAAACGQHVRRLLQQAADHPPLARAELRLAALGEDLRDGPPRRQLDLLVRVPERQA